MTAACKIYNIFTNTRDDILLVMDYPESWSKLFGIKIIPPEEQVMNNIASICARAFDSPKGSFLRSDWYGLP